jgi:hypothetical protein
MGKWTLERWLTIAAVCITVGINWNALTTQQQVVQKLQQFNETTLPEKYVSREIYDLNQQHLTEAINRLTESLEKLYALEQQTGEPTRIQRQYGH